MEYEINCYINALLFGCSTCGVIYISFLNNKEHENKEKLHNINHLIYY